MKDTSKKSVNALKTPRILGKAQRDLFNKWSKFFKVMKVNVNMHKVEMFVVYVYYRYLPDGFKPNIENHFHECDFLKNSDLAVMYFFSDRETAQINIANVYKALIGANIELKEENRADGVHLYCKKRELILSFQSSIEVEPFTKEGFETIRKMYKDMTKHMSKGEPEGIVATEILF